MWTSDLNYPDRGFFFSFFFFNSQNICTNLEYLKVVCLIFAIAFLYNLDT